MVQTIGHGGGCCGVNHIASFSSTPHQGEVDSLIRYSPTRTQDTCILKEIVLTKGQLYSKANVALRGNVRGNYSWAEILEILGYKLVTIFQNSNSNNYCFVFHLCSRTYDVDQVFNDMNNVDDVMQALKNMDVRVPQVIERVPIVVEEVLEEEDQIIALRELIPSAERIINSQRLPERGISKAFARAFIESLNQGE